MCIRDRPQSAQAEAPAEVAVVVETVAVAPAAEVERPVVEVSPAPEPVATATVAGGGTSSGNHALRFAAKGGSWVQVRNAQDKVVMEKILKAGDVFEESIADRPLQIVVGNAGATTLEVDGASLDLVASARNNVARIEVK